MQALKKAEEKQQEAPDDLKREAEPSLHELADELSLEPVASGRPADRRVAGQENPRPETARQETPQAGREDFQSAANVFSAKSPQTQPRQGRGLALGGVAALLLLAGGAYTYVEINHPALWRNLGSGLMPRQTAVAPAIPLANAPAPAAIRSEEPPVRMIPADDMPLASAPLEKPFRSPQVETGTGAKEALHKWTPPLAAPAPESGIKIARAEPGVVNPELLNAYEAMQLGRLEVAQAHYQRVLQQEPRNLDALLGQAAIESRMGHASEAGRLYLRALEVEPGNLYAQAGFVGLMGSADPVGSEARLKQLLATQPASFLYFALGNLYAGQNRWSEAQQANFQAFHLEPASPDYAFNLAVSLDQLKQPRQALDYYKQALMLSRGKSASFDARVLEARISQLQGR